MFLKLFLLISRTCNVTTVAPRVVRTSDSRQVSRIPKFDDFADFRPRDGRRMVCRAQKRCLGIVSDVSDHRLPAQLPLSFEHHRFWSRPTQLRLRSTVWPYEYSYLRTVLRGGGRNIFNPGFARTHSGDF